MLRMRCVLSSGCEHDRILELGDNRDSPLHGESMRHYNRCLRPPALHCLCYGTTNSLVLPGNIRGARLHQRPAMAAGRLC